MSFITVVTKILGSTIFKKLLILGLEEAAKRSDNTIDDEVVRIVKAGLNNWVDPVARVVGDRAK